MTDMEKKFAIVDFEDFDFMKSQLGEVLLYDTKEEALLICAMYELEDVWVVQLIQNYKD